MKKTPPLSIYKKIATVFIAVTILLVALIFYFSLTFAFIEVTPKVTEKEYPVSLLITEQRSAVDPLKGVFEGNLLSQSFELKDTFAATGKMTVKSNANGKVTIINNNSKPQPLIATTRLLTADNVLFRIKDGVTVPAGGRAEVAAYLDNPAAGANVKVGDRLTIPGLSDALRAVIYAEISTDFNGDEREVTVVTKEDLDKAAESLLLKMEDTLRSQTTSQDRVVLKPEITKKEFSALANDQVDTFEAKVSATLSGVAFSEAATTDYLVKLVEGVISLDEEIAGDQTITVDYSIDNIDAKAKSAQLNGVIKAPLVVRQNSSILDPKKLVRLSSSEVKAYLENYPEIEKVEVKFFPFWVKKVPAFADHVIISINSGLTEKSE